MALESRTMRVAAPPYGMEFQAKIKVHAKADCKGPCPFHKPSKHHMRKWETCMRMDRHPILVERVCEHGCGHPDPDTMAFIYKNHGERVGLAAAIHGCDGCCNPEGKK